MWSFVQSVIDKTSNILHHTDMFELRKFRQWIVAGRIGQLHTKTHERNLLEETTYSSPTLLSAFKHPA